MQRPSTDIRIPDQLPENPLEQTVATRPRLVADPADVAAPVPPGAHAAAVGARLADLLAAGGPFTGLYRDMLAAPGKRLRAGLVLASAQCPPPGSATGVPGTDLLDLACAIEMLHDASLLHDDICDSSPLRRGAPSGAAGYGIRFAGLAGFHLAGTALHVLADVLERHPAVRRRIAETRDDATYVDGLGALSQGQLIENMPPTTDPAMLRPHYLTVAAAKTGTLFRVGCSYGGVFAGCGGAGLRALMTYADELAVAFQIMDDIRDIEGAPTLGKAAGTDLARSIPTWPVIEWLELRPEARPVWLAAVGGGLSPAVLEAARLDVVASGATERARLAAVDRAGLAAVALAGFPPSAGRAHLLDLADRVVAR